MFEMKKIAFFTGSMARGGAERVIRNLSFGFAERGYEVEIVTVLSSEIEYDLPETVKVVDCSSRNGRIFGAVDRIVDYLARSDIDAAFVFMWQISLVFGAALKKIKNRDFYLVMSERNDPRRPVKRRLLTTLVNAAYKKADALVFQTERAARFFPEKIRRKSVVIPNVVDVRVSASEEPKKKIVTAGRLERQKNQAMLIRAFGSFAKIHGDYVLEIYGEGKLREELEKEIKDLGLEKKAFLMGNVPDVHDKIKDAEFFVLSSEYEGLSNAMLEAMAMGLPVIATDCAGSDEYIKNGENGYVVKRGDVNALADAMNSLAGDRAKRKAFGEAAVVSVSALKKENVTEKWFSLIDDRNNGEKE